MSQDVSKALPHLCGASRPCVVMPPPPTSWAEGAAARTVHRWRRSQLGADWLPTCYFPTYVIQTCRRTVTKPFHFQWKASAAEEGVDAGGAAGLFSQVISAVRMMWRTGGPQHQASRARQNGAESRSWCQKVPLTSHQRPGTDEPPHVNTTTHMCSLHEHFNGLKPRYSLRSIVLVPPPLTT